MRGRIEEAHQRLVDQLIARGALWSRPLIEAFRTTPRHLFLDRIYDYQRARNQWRQLDVSAGPPGRDELALIYSDRVLATRLSEEECKGSGVPISSSSQPSLMAQMLEDLQPAPGLRVLEVGSGTGFNAALLARVVSSVVSVEIDRRVLREAEEHVRRLDDRKVEFHHRDGRDGYPPRAPYDRIMVTAATADLEPAWLEQTADEGMVLAPLALAPGLAYVVCGRVVEREFRGRLTRPAYFMPLRGADARPAARDTVETLTGPERLAATPAPWEGWHERKLHLDLVDLQHALAFLGWLAGCTVNYQTLADGRPGYGVGDADRVCWLGSRQWYVNGVAGRDLGLRLWRTFLEAGGPRPSEFHLAAHARQEHGSRYPLEPASSVLTFHRQGACCNQTWALPEPRVKG
jgi:protein-L-isoaspartate(D-aspartate) O-methyltransferase